MVQFSIAISGDREIEEYISIGKIVDQSDFSNLSIYDDLMFKPAWPILSIIAINTERIKIGPAVLNPYLTHPAVIAANISVIDEISNGRSFVGIGRGAFLDFLNIKSENPVNAVKEAIEIIQPLTAGTKKPFHGEIFSLKEGAFFRWNADHGKIPVMVGTWGKKMSTLAGEKADEVKASPLWNSEYAQTLRSQIDQGAISAGRAPSEIGLTLGVLTSIHSDSDVAKEYARNSLAIYLPHLYPMTEVMGVPPNEIANVRKLSNLGKYSEASKLISDETLNNFSLYGSPVEIRSKITSLIDTAPVDKIEFGTPHGPNSFEAINLLKNEVIPWFS